MAYSEDVNINLNLLSGTMAGATAIMSGMSAMTSSFASMGTEASNAFGALDALLVTATGMIAAFGLEAANAFGEFEQGMKIVQTVSNQTGAAINELTNRANEMSIAYRTSIGDITEGLQTLGRAGLNSVNDQLELLESGLQTAKLEGRNLNGVLEELLQNTAMLGGDLKSSDFGSQADYLNSLMVGTSMTAPIDSHDISQTLQYAGGTAAAAGASLDSEVLGGKDRIEDLMGTIAAFAQKGVKGSMSGTALRAFFTKPASQDESVTTALSTLGLSPEDLWEDGGESMKKVSDQIGIIQRRMDALHLSTMDQVELWGKMVGPKMGQQMMKLDSSDIKDLTRDIQSAQSAEDLATKTLHTYNQKLSEMQQQGELAFREFGAKAVTFLNPVVDVINTILKLLSNPYINLGVFATIGAIISHGLQKAWSMATSLWGQIKGLLNDTIAGIENINNLAGGSSTGFAKSASDVEFLNRKLLETDATLQQIQAKSMHIRPGYQLPGGLYTDPVQKGTLKAYTEDVVHDKEGIMGRPGAYLPGDQKDKFLESLDEQSAKQKTEKEAMIAQNEADIASKKAEIEELNARKLSIHDVQNDDAIARMEVAEAELKAECDAIIEKARLEVGATAKEIEELKANLSDEQLRAWEKFGVPPDIQDEVKSDPELQYIASTSGINSKEYKAALNEYIAQSKYRDIDLNNVSSGMSQEEFDEFEKKTKKEYSQKIRDAKNRATQQSSQDYSPQMQEVEEQRKKAEAELKELESKTFDDIPGGYSKSELKKIKEQSINKVRTELRLLDEAEYEAWKKRQNGRGELGEYSLSRTNELYDENSIVHQYYGKDLNALKSKGQYLVVESHEVADSHPNAQVIGQSINDDTLRAMSEAKDDVVRRQAELFKGQNNFSQMYDRAAQNTTTKMSKFSDGISKANSKLRDFRTGITNSVKRMGRSKDYALKNVGSLQKDALAALNDKDFVAQKIAGQEVGTAMANLAREVNLSATEFSLLLDSESEFKVLLDATDAELEQLGVTALELREALAQNIVAEEEDTLATEQKIMATREAALAEEAEAMSDMGGMLGGLKKAGAGIIDMAGGPLMAVIMAVTVGMQIVQDYQRKWQEAMQESIDKINEQMEKQGEAEDEIKKEYNESHEGASEAELDEHLLESYASIYDSVRENNMSALNENTLALMRATEAYKQATEDSEDVVFDKVLGVGQWGSELSDRMGTFGAWMGDFGDDITTLADGLSKGKVVDALNSSDRSWYNVNKERGWSDDDWEKTSGAGYFDSNSIVLTASQESDDYPWLKEFSPIFASDVWDLGVAGGLKQAFGADFNKIADILTSTTGKSGIEGFNATAFGTQAANINRHFKDAHQQNLLQSGLKNYQDDFRAAGYQTRAFEKASGGKSALSVYQQGVAGSKGKEEPNKAGFKALQKAGNKDTNKLINYIKTLSIKTGMDEQRVLMATQLQQMQEMNGIANDVVAPQMLAQTEQAMMQVAYAQGTLPAAQNAANGAVTAGDNAAAIASLLQVQMEEKLRSGAATYAVDTLDIKEAAGMSDMEIYAKMREEYDKMVQTGQSTKWGRLGAYYLESYATANGLMYGRSDDTLKSYVNDFMDAAKSNDFKGALATLRQGSQGAISQSILDQYDLQAAQADGAGSSGSGGGSGSGSGSGDKSTGSTTNRVDLVLCNKKTIPKLNVNLFKKPPNFTIKNKQFSIRDIKINTEDKPDAMVDAIKNGIIKTQKQMDPKIIQDETAVYDPTAATDGNATPKGKTPVKTNSS